MHALRKTILNMISVAALCVTLGACASQPKHSFSSEVDPSAESKALSAEMVEMKADQLDVLAPVQFARASKAIISADRQIDKEGDRTAILNDLQIAKNEIQQARSEGAKWKPELAEAVVAREKALAAGADKSFKNEFAAIDSDMKNITDDSISAGAYRKASLNLQKDYMDVELKAIQHNELGQARKLLEASKDSGAKRYAPQSLEKTAAEIASAERQVAANRNEAGLYSEAVAKANRSARTLLSVTMTAKDARNKTPEEIALAIRAKENEIARTERRALELESVTEAQDAALVRKEGELASQSKKMTAELTAAQAANSELEKENTMNAKLKNIESKFSKNEADVYRQGDTVVVRLKSMQFANSRSDLPAKSLATLAKVNGAIQELGAEKVVVEGHTDSVGTAEINQKISQERAQSVSQYLVSQSAATADKVQAVGFGFNKPLMTNKTKEGRAQNRRVDIVITPSIVQ